MSCLTILSPLVRSLRLATRDAIVGRINAAMLVFLLAITLGCETEKRSASESEAVFRDMAAPVTSAGGAVTVRVDLSGTAADDQTLVKLPLLEIAEAVDLSDTKVTQDGLAHLARVGVNVRSLDLTGMTLTAEALESLKQMPKLEFVNIHHGEVPRDALMDLMQFLSDRSAKRAPSGAQTNTDSGG